MRQEHMLQWRCPAKSHKPVVFQTRAEFEDHMWQHHRGTFSEKQLPLLAKRSAQPNGPTFPSCPLCGHSETNISRMESHVVQHLRFLALKSLPWPDDVEDRPNDVEDTPSSKASGKPNTRTTIATDSEHGTKPTFYEVPYDAPERPSDRSESYEEKNPLFEKSHLAMRTEEWGFLGGAFAERSTEPEGVGLKVLFEGVVKGKLKCKLIRLHSCTLADIFANSSGKY